MPRVTIIKPYSFCSVDIVEHGYAGHFDEYFYYYNPIPLETIYLPNVTTIEDHGFYNSTILKKIYAPNLTSIGEWAFNNSGLLSIDLSNISFIGEAAFDYCYLNYIVISCNNVITCDIKNIYSYDPTYNFNKNIYVPDDLVDSYKSDTNWSTYASQIKPISELPQELKEEYNI